MIKIYPEDHAPPFIIATRLRSEDAARRVCLRKPILPVSGPPFIVEAKDGRFYVCYRDRGEA